MEVAHVTWFGPPIDDRDILEALPQNGAALLRQYNGFIQMHGGLHVRGACVNPDWHSLRRAWYGPESFQALYPGVIHESDIPFAENCIGNQYLMRDGQVVFLRAATGELESLDMRLSAFLAKIADDPATLLELQPLRDFQRLNHMLEPGQLLSLDLPSDDGTGRAVPVLELRCRLAKMAKSTISVAGAGR